MMQNSKEIFLLSKDNDFGKLCYSSLKKIKHDAKAVLYMNLEKCLQALKEDKAEFLIVDDDTISKHEQYKLSLIKLSKQKIVYLNKNCLKNGDAQTEKILNDKITTFYPIANDDTEKNDYDYLKKRTEKPDIVGIGASTGGPKTLCNLFQSLNSNLPFPIVIVNHIPSGDFAESLAKSVALISKIPVTMIKGDTVLSKGHAYICPGGHHIKVSKVQGKKQYVAKLTTDPPLRSCRPSIDYFFESLSKLKFTNVSAFVLTGMGTDGTIGAQMISQRGGCIMAQDPSEAVIKSMPESLIKSKASSKVLTIAEIAYHLNKGLFTFGRVNNILNILTGNKPVANPESKSALRSSIKSESARVNDKKDHIPSKSTTKAPVGLSKSISKPEFNSTLSRTTGASSTRESNQRTSPAKESSSDKFKAKKSNANKERIVADFRSLLEMETFNTGKQDTYFTLTRKLESLMKKYELSSYEELYLMAKKRRTVRDEVIDLLTNHETFFFRDKYPYDFISNVFVPESIGKKRQTNIWSAACSNGQEPYSIAMTLDNTMNLKKKSTDQFKIYATDVSKEAVKRASDGFFSSGEINRGLSKNYLRYFKNTGGKFEANYALKKLIKFQAMNIHRISPGFPTFDLIFLRYVLIYFDDKDKAKAIQNVESRLNKGGYLILDAATALNTKSSRLKAVRFKSQTIFQKI